MTKFVWGEEEIEKLRVLLSKNMSASSIAKELVDVFGTRPTRNAVVGKAHREKLKFTRVFKNKPTGRPRMLIRVCLPPPPVPQKVTQKVVQKKFTRVSELSEFSCRCILDDGTRCRADRAPRSSWCEYHRERFTIPSRK